MLPSQLVQFYKTFGADYGPLLLDTPPSSIAHIYRNLECAHSLQPPPLSGTEARFAEPILPALKVQGWITWETIQLLLNPEEHASYMIAAVELWNLKDPITGKPFPKLLPRACFPAEPDKHMEEWYQGVSTRLQQAAEEEQLMLDKSMEDEQRPARLDYSRRDESDDFGAIQDETRASRRPGTSALRASARSVRAIPAQGPRRAATAPLRSSIDPGSSRSPAFSVSRFVRQLWEGNLGQIERDMRHSRRVDPSRAREHRRRQQSHGNSARTESRSDRTKKMQSRTYLDVNFRQAANSRHRDHELESESDTGTESGPEDDVHPYDKQRGQPGGIYRKPSVVADLGVKPPSVGYSEYPPPPDLIPPTPARSFGTSSGQATPASDNGVMDRSGVDPRLSSWLANSNPAPASDRPGEAFGITGANAMATQFNVNMAPRPARPEDARDGAKQAFDTQHGTSGGKDRASSSRRPRADGKDVSGSRRDKRDRAANKPGRPLEA